jgi:alginate O-acetyltransferase complex protein AlgI
MLFSSPAFIIFFVAYFCFHLLVPSRYRVYVIICGSTIFYAWWKVAYTWLPYFLMAVAYIGAIWIDRATQSVSRKWRTFVTIAFLFFPLLLFKYTDFIYRDVLGPFFDWHGKILDIPLPLGVSFVTFTLTAYVVDIYRGQYVANSRLSVVLAYVLFFPHLIAGPILRPNELIPQLEHPRRILLRHLTPGIAIFTAGLIKKLVFADQIAQVIDAVYAHGAVVTGPAAILAIYGFSIQI